MLQLLAEGPPLHSDTGREDLCHPLQGGECRRRVGGIHRVGIFRGGRPQEGDAQVSRRPQARQSLPFGWGQGTSRAGLSAEDGAGGGALRLPNLGREAAGESRGLGRLGNPTPGDPSRGSSGQGGPGPQVSHRWRMGRAPPPPPAWAWHRCPGAWTPPCRGSSSCQAEVAPEGRPSMTRAHSQPPDPRVLLVEAARRGHRSARSQGPASPER